MLNRYLPILLLLTIIIIIAWQLWSTPKKVNWSHSYSKEDVIPLGTKVLYDVLPNLFDKAIVPIDDRISDHLVGLGDSLNTTPNSCYIILNQSFYPSQKDMKMLQKYVEEGNMLFMIVEHLNYKLTEKWGIISEYNITKYDKKTEKYNTRFYFTNTQLKIDSAYLFQTKYHVSNIGVKNTLNVDTLGQQENGKVNFIRFPLGKGWVYYHSVPQAFSNYQILDQPNDEYIAKVFSHIPANYTVYWDEFYKVKNPMSYYDPEDMKEYQERETNNSMFSQLLKSKALTWALYLSLAGILLFFLFEAKRRQRAIPIIRPVQNTTLDFAQTIGMLYLNHGDHKDIIQKKMQYFEETVRSRYHLATHLKDEQFYKKLAGKSGVSQEIIERIYHFYHTFEEKPIGDEDLLYFNQLMENFDG